MSDLEKKVAELSETVSKLENVEQILDREEKKKKADVLKQNEMLIRRERLEKKISELEKIPQEQLIKFKERIPNKDLESGKNKLLMVYIFSSIDSTMDALKKLFIQKRDYVEKMFFPIWVNLDVPNFTNEKIKLFNDSDELPITPLVLIMGLDGEVQSRMMGFGAIKEFLTKGGD